MGKVLFFQYIESEKKKIPLSKSPNWSGLLELLVLQVWSTGTTGLVYWYYWYHWSIGTTGTLVLLVYCPDLLLYEYY